MPAESEEVALRSFSWAMYLVADTMVGLIADATGLNLMDCLRRAGANAEQRGVIVSMMR